MTKALTCYHFGDSLDDPWRTMLLLRSWSIWRTRWMGWARAQPFRLREVARQVERLTADLRLAHEVHDVPLRQPLFGSAVGHTLVTKWTADIVSALLPAQ